MKRIKQAIKKMACKKGQRVKLPYEMREWKHVAAELNWIQKKPYRDLTEALACLARVYGAAERTKLHFNDTPYAGLAVFFDKKASKDEIESFLSESLPAIAELALRGESWMPSQGLYYCAPLVPCSVTLRRPFVASLVALGFLCLYPEEGGHSERTSLNFSSFLQPMFYVTRMPSQSAKLRFVLNYFARLHRLQYHLPGCVTYRRLVLRNPFRAQDLLESRKPLCDVTVDRDGRIEDTGCNTLQMDFANMYIGGGVLAGGNVQEEIRFTVCPELLAAMLFMPRMEPEEAIVIQGFEQFSEYANYGSRLEFAQSMEDASGRDESGDLLNCLSAIDAIPFSFSRAEQYAMTNILRDINKAYIGFLQPYVKGDYKERELVNQRKEQSTRSENDSKTPTSTKERPSTSERGSRRQLNRVQDRPYSGQGTSGLPGRKPVSGDRVSRDPTGSANQREDKNVRALSLDSMPKKGKATEECKPSKGSTEVPEEKNAGSGASIDQSKEDQGKRPVATGNWGCGAFGGNPQLKSLLQWIAASQADCPRMIYCTFREPKVEGLDQVVQHIKKNKLNVGMLFQRIQLIIDLIRKEQMSKSIFDFMMSMDSSQM